MNKIEAANYLGISARTLERYTQKKALPVSYINGPRGGSQAVYQKADLDGFKEKIKQGQQTRQQSMVIDIGVPDADTSPRQARHRQDRDVELLSITQAIIAGLLPNMRSEPKLTLTLTEAVEWSGLPEEFLREAISRKKKPLKVILIGKDGLRVRRSDLKKFIDRL